MSIEQTIAKARATIALFKDEDGGGEGDDGGGVDDENRDAGGRFSGASSSADAAGGGGKGGKGGKDKGGGGKGPKLKKPSATPLQSPGSHLNPAPSGMRKPGTVAPTGKDAAPAPAPSPSSPQDAPQPPIMRPSPFPAPGQPPPRRLPHVKPRPAAAPKVDVVRLAKSTLGRVRLARALDQAAVSTFVMKAALGKDYNPEQSRDEGGRFGSGGGGAQPAPTRPAAAAPETSRPDGKPYYQPPPEIGDANHPNARAEPPTRGSDYQEGTRTDPKMWEQYEPGGNHFYSGDDEAPQTDHAWPTARGDASKADELIGHIGGKMVNGPDYRQLATDTVRQVAQDNPLAHWVLEAHPLPTLTVSPIQGSDRANGTYSDQYKEIRINATQLDPKTFKQIEGSFKMGESWSLNAGARTPEERAQGTFLHELGHHVATAPGVRDVMLDAWNKREASGAYAAASQYARTNADEYFAESWTAYNRDRDGFKEHDFAGHEMIERSLAVLERMRPG
jgi:hypothetical protein